MASSVDFPQPDGPEIDTYSPLRTFSSMPASAWVSTSSVLNTLKTLLRLISVVSESTNASFPERPEQLTLSSDRRTYLKGVRFTKNASSERQNHGTWL